MERGETKEPRDPLVPPDPKGLGDPKQLLAVKDREDKKETLDLL